MLKSIFGLQNTCHICLSFQPTDDLIWPPWSTNSDL